MVTSAPSSFGPSLFCDECNAALLTADLPWWQTAQWIEEHEH
jgi:hypothetical protein